MMEVAQLFRGRVKQKCLAMSLHHVQTLAMVPDSVLLYRDFHFIDIAHQGANHLLLVAFTRKPTAEPHTNVNYFHASQFFSRMRLIGIK